MFDWQKCTLSCSPCHAPPTHAPNVWEFTGDANFLKCHRVQTPQISKEAKKIYHTNYYQQARKKHQINFFVHLGFDLSAEGTNKGFHLMAVLVAVSVTCPSIYSFLPLGITTTNNWIPTSLLGLGLHWATHFYELTPMQPSQKAWTSLLHYNILPAVLYFMEQNINVLYNKFPTKIN